ncbi:membrane dipeptidase [Altererythrobacter salegens]|uniref:Membrane dipeptidase n=1 Tax=Croceibacterium salegens TaxID=1737568 RepID=A0A6I4STF4_9SPHN|nr:dipeptidase [Croceibacterium salegens]MXO58210.1 membrane dipeptidase [Croceibacterium salegens]
MKRLILPLAVLLTSVPLAAQTPEQTAEAALREAPVWDGHNDVPEGLRNRRGNVLAGFDFNDTTHEPDPRTGGTSAMNTDFKRMAQGHLGAQFWSIYVSADLAEPQAVLETLEQIDVLKRLVAKYPDRMMLATSSADVAAAFRQGKVASLMGIEGGHSIGSSLGALRQMYALGARYMTLTHYKNTPWADSADDKPVHGGLTDFGRDVVREMNRLGMVVDLSHVSADTMRDALEVARAPVMFSHSNTAALTDESRNVPDDVLATLKDNGGIVMVTGVADFISEGRRSWLAEQAAEKARLEWLWQGQPGKVAERLQVWLKDHPPVAVTVSELADHVDHIRAVAGIDHIGVGGDYDGWYAFPVGMEDVSGYPKLFAELARRGYSKADLEKISSGNMMRVMKAVEAYAAAHRGDPPIERPVK